MVALEELKRQSSVATDSRFPIRAWLKAGQKVKEAAEKDDREGNLEAAYVGYRKVAKYVIERCLLVPPSTSPSTSPAVCSLLKAVLEHPEYKTLTSAKVKSPDYFVYTDLKARVIPMTHRVREIEQILTKREPEHNGSDGPSGSLNSNASSSNTLESTDSVSTMPMEDLLDSLSAPIARNPQLTNGHHKSVPPPIPPSSTKPVGHVTSEPSSASSGSHYSQNTTSVPSTPLTPSSPSKHAHPRVSGNLQARMAALYNAGMQSAGEHAGKSPLPPPSPTESSYSQQSASEPVSNGPPPTTLKRSPAIHHSNLPLPGSQASPPRHAHYTPSPSVHRPPMDSAHTQSILNKRTESPAQADDPSKDIERPESAPSSIPSSTAPASGPATHADNMMLDPPTLRGGPSNSPNSLHVATSNETESSLPSLYSPIELDNFSNRFPDVQEAGFDILPSAPSVTPGDKNRFEKSKVPKPFQPLPNGYTPNKTTNPLPPRKSSVSSVSTDNTGGTTASTSMAQTNGVNGYTSAQFQQAAASKPPPPAAPGQRPARPPLPPTPQQPSLPNSSATLLSPSDLWSYIESSSSGPSVLLIDVRSRREFASGRVKGKNVCIESFTLSPNSSAFAIENSLVVSPEQERQWFAERASFDLIVIYDRSTRVLPDRSAANHHQSVSAGGFRNTPVSSVLGGASREDPNSSFATASQEAKAITYLCSAIYEFNFSDEGKRLKRRPLLLTGGWDAWSKEVGEKGIERDPLPMPGQNGTKEAEYQAMLTNSERSTTESPKDLKKQYRKAVMSGDGTIASPTSYGREENILAQLPPAYQGYSNPTIAVPPVAVHRTGPASPYDAYPSTSARAAMFSGNAPVRQVSGSGEYFESYNARPPSQYGLVSQHQGPYPSARPIDYPTLQRQRMQTGSPGRPQQPPLQQIAPPQGKVQVPPPALARTASSNYVDGSVPQFQLLQNASYLTNPVSGAFPKQFYAQGDGAVGLTGLKNLGNTCYMNSMVQCLSATIPVARFLKEGSYKKAINKTNPLGTKGVLADAVAQLIQTLWSEQYSFLAPITFRDAICRFAPQFKGSDQHDSQEFLAFLLDGLHEDLNLIINKPPPVEFTPEREKELETLPTQIAAEREWNIYLRRDDSIIVRLLQGQYKSQLRCLTCAATSTTYNTFMYLSLPLPTGKGLTHVTLAQCIDLFTRPETLDGDDAWNCPKCKKPRRATKALTISRLPAVLLIHLKRFSFQGPFTNKIDTSVVFPVRGLDLTNYVPPPLDPALEARYSSAVGGKGLEKMPRPIYDLHAVSNHFGSLSSGHYTAFIKSRGHWNELNDSKITRTDEAHVQAAGKSAYTLWYSRRP